MTYEGETMTYEEVDSNYPKHGRTSCSDEHRDNRDPDGSGCVRCNALEFADLDNYRLQASEAITGLKKSLAPS